MKSIQWSDWKSIINMIINLIINLIIFYTFVIKRYISWDIIINDKLSYNNHKNLNDFIRIFSEYYSQIMWSFMIIYQYVYMRTIVQSMNSSIFRKIFGYKHHSLIVFATITAIFLPFTIHYINLFLSTKYDFFSLFLGYCIDRLFFMPLIIIGYVKYATNKLLELYLIQQINLNQNKFSTQNEHMQCRKIRELARINRYFSKILSPLLLVCSISINLDMISFFFWHTKNSPFLITFLSLLSFWICFAYVAYQDKQIDRLLKKIIKILQINQFKCCCRCHQYRQFNRRKNRSIDNDRKTSITKSFYCSHNVRHIEFYKEYLNDFHLTLFNICRIDFSFLFNSILFTMTFIILSLQILNIVK